MESLRIGQEDEYLPLLMAIEMEIRKAYSSNPRMRDIDALRAVQEAKNLLRRRGTKASSLAASIVKSAESVAALNGYAREEALMCLSHVATSIRTHRRVDGARGYLNFIGRFLP